MRYNKISRIVNADASGRIPLYVLPLITLNNRIERERETCCSITLLQHHEHWTHWIAGNGRRCEFSFYDLQTGEWIDVCHCNNILNCDFMLDAYNRLTDTYTLYICTMYNCTSHIHNATQIRFEWYVLILTAMFGRTLSTHFGFGSPGSTCLHACMNAFAQATTCPLWQTDMTLSDRRIMHWENC